jgi:hypothetical protein
MKLKNVFFIGILLFFILIENSVFSYIFHITPEQAHIIAQKIWNNECNGTIEGLMTWNAGEGFASVGIGHFIWYPKNKKGVFRETFPTFIQYLKKQRKIIPSWLEHYTECPWNSRTEFLAAKKDKQFLELLQLLQETIDLQAQFMIDRFKNSAIHLKKKLPLPRYIHIKNQLDRMINTSQGIYALIDYLNFKGEGFNPEESYNGQGWGLIQVLENMKGSKKGAPALEEFAQSAKYILNRRVQNSPPEHNEKRWLSGWLNRIDTYTKAY